MDIKVSYNKIPTAPRKLRLLIGDLRGKSVPQALALVASAKQLIVEHVDKLLRSSISAAKDKNANLQAEDLFVKTLYCNEGSRRYRTRFKGRGRASRFAKRTSHLILVITDKKES